MATNRDQDQSASKSCMATFAPHDAIVRHLEAMTGRSDGQRLFDALVRRGMVKRWDAVEDFWALEAFDDESWALLSRSIEIEA